MALDINSMKNNRLVIILTCFVTSLFISCRDDDSIILIDKYVEVDYRAQDVVIFADEDIDKVTYDVAHSDTELGDHYIDGHFKYSKGDWFVLIFDTHNPRQVVVSMHENQTGNDRQVEVYITRNAGSDSAIVVQKAKPTE